MSRRIEVPRSNEMTKSLTLSSSAALAALALADMARADALSTPSLTGPLSANPNPPSVETPFGKVYVDGAITGLAWAQTAAVPGDRDGGADWSNAQVFLQKTDGKVQFYLQAGAYSLPSLGTQYWGLVNESNTAGKFFGPVPVAYIKLQASPEFTLQGGALPTLVGAESTFTFQNMNIERGLLWNQENDVNRGFQLNYAKGPWAVSLSVNDGYYSNRLNWMSGSAAYTFSPKDSLTFVGAGNFGATGSPTTAAPLLQNNSQIYNLIWTHTEKTWAITPYVQYQVTPENLAAGILHRVSTTGAAVLGRWQITDLFSLAARGEYITSSGPQSLLYGPHSKAWSLTLTPTLQIKTYFVRAEASYVKADDATPGFAFGRAGNATSQTRGMLETGFLF
jgi:hypothetical protein